MPTIQDTIKRALLLKGPKVFDDEDELLALIEDLSPTLKYEIDFIRKVYNAKIGKRLYSSCEVSVADKINEKQEVDKCLAEDYGLCDSWRECFFDCFDFVFTEEVDMLVKRHEEIEERNRNKSIRATEPVVEPEPVVNEQEAAVESESVVEPEPVVAPEPVAEPEPANPPIEVKFKVVTRGEPSRWPVYSLASANDEIVVKGSDISKNLSDDVIFTLHKDDEGVLIQNQSDITWSITVPDGSVRTCEKNASQYLEKGMKIVIIDHVVQINVMDVNS